MNFMGSNEYFLKENSYITYIKHLKKIDLIYFLWTKGYGLYLQPL
jgi:hypothetical protein